MTFNINTIKIKFVTPKFPSSVEYGFSRGVGLVTLTVYDITGQKVQTLVNEQLQTGTYEITFDGSALTSRVYFYKLITDSFIETRRMLLIK
jgi:hypothetical protein